MVRKIFKTGNSLVISLPKESIGLLGLHEGSEVSVAVDQQEGRIIIEPAQVTLTDIDPAFTQQVNDFIEQYRPALEALAK
ncbi:MAG: AbrB/MazE/SpoVT family DNA-binding domain-containing protein [Ardenticatenaceae bacterium]|nr:AbrB/MazE/SpoVT family DNA-binding domain-containing protein [Ardenticatenaceae bacterium]